MRLNEIVTTYDECINRCDIAGLAEMIDDDYVFIDTAGAKVTGRQASIAMWQGFFTRFPDYRNDFETIKEIDDHRVVITGRSVCSFKPLNGPALWSAQVRDGEVFTWQVYDDTAANRKKLGAD